MTTADIHSALTPGLLERVAAETGTPFWIYEAPILRRRIADVRAVTDSEGVQARYAMKACPATRVLREMRAAGIWLDTVSGNEILRALQAGFPGGNEPPMIFLTSDVFRDNALAVVRQHGILPNLGSPGMIRQLAEAGYAGPVGLRVNPGFGHGHVNSCDTGGPSSKHGIWHEALPEALAAARAVGLEVRMLHAHIGSGPRFQELMENLEHLAQVFAELIPRVPALRAISLGGGIPHHYRDRRRQVDLTPLRDLFQRTRQRLSDLAGRPLRLEIEPGRYFVAPSGSLITRVHDVKQTQTNAKGAGVTFAMVDAGFVDLIRPALYGSYHEIEVAGRDGTAERADVVVAGPLCESGDIFTRDDRELLVPRNMPRPESGDLMLLRDAGAYGYSMSSTYNSIGRAPQVWLEEDGSTEIISRRETISDLLQLEVDGTHRQTPNPAHTHNLNPAPAFPEMTESG